MRLIGHMVTRNEMGRYLPQTLGWLADITDGNVLVYDDQSTDGTVAYVNQQRLPLAIRADTTPSFREDESAFRRAAWRVLEQAYLLTTDDWILCIDADEFLVSESSTDPEEFREQLEEAMTGSAVTFRVREVFGHDGAGWPLIRSDGYWGSILAARLMRWRPGGHFATQRQGGGSVPSNWPKATRINDDLAILHYGYARAEDRQERYTRYAGTLGHNPAHIASITRQPLLRTWKGMAPPHLEAGTA